MTGDEVDAALLDIGPWLGIAGLLPPVFVLESPLLPIGTPCLSPVFTVSEEDASSPEPPKVWTGTVFESGIGS